MRVEQAEPVHRRDQHPFVRLGDERRAQGGEVLAKDSRERLVAQVGPPRAARGRRIVQGIARHRRNPTTGYKGDRGGASASIGPDPTGSTTVLREIADREANDQKEPIDSEARVGYQGEVGAFGEQAAAAHGGQPIPFASFEKLLAALGQGQLDEVVVPIDNAVVGAIAEALDPLAAAVVDGLDLVATGLTSVPVRLALAAKTGTPLRDVRRAFSHPAALRQCRQRLAGLGIEPVVAYDTAGAATLVGAERSTHAGG